MIKSLLIFGLLTSFYMVNHVFGQIELEWSFLHPLKKEWIDLGEKGSVQEGLIATGELPDPFYGTNEGRFGWIEDHIWEFKSIFFVDKDELEKDFLELEFQNIDTYAEVYLNGTKILSAQNAFKPYRVQVKGIMSEGVNELVAVFTPPVIYHKDKKKEIGYELPAPNDVHENAIAPYTRKPQYQFGWDWALRMNTIGFNKPVKIWSYNNGRVINKTTRIISVDSTKAVLEFDLHLSNSAVKEVVWDSKLFGKANVKGKKGIFTRRVEVLNPELWWPRGQGESHLYEDEFLIQTVSSNHIIDRVNHKFGIKTSELIQEKDQWGTSYYFKINGRRVFAKGADYIPQEIFPARVTDSAIVSMIEMMAESNFNMIRVWGGGYYPDDIFFEKCDELGIMVWEDLMFACAMYPGDDEFLENITCEFEYQIPRIGGHPSVVLFNGNNEVEVAWGNWGFQVKYGLYGKSAKTIEKAYDDIFKKTAPEVITKHSTIPYVHTSPLSNWGKMEFYNHGSQHYWGVWHGKDPIEDFGKKIGRFNAEYGFQSFPEYQTLETFAKKEDWSLKSEVMKHHQKSYVGNDMILKHAKRLYGEPKDFEEFVYYSQLTQSMAVSMAVAGHRIDAPRCGGTLYWQLNDCWPAPTWSSIDYLGNWKALHYQMQKDFADVAIVEKYDDLATTSFYLVADKPGKETYQIQIAVLDLEGTKLDQKTVEFTLEGESSERIDLPDFKSVINDQNHILQFECSDSKGSLFTRSFERIIKDYAKAELNDFEIEITEVDLSNKKAVLKLSAGKFARKLWITSTLPKVHFKQNFINVLPGETFIEFDFESLPELKDIQLKWM